MIKITLAFPNLNCYDVGKISLEAMKQKENKIRYFLYARKSTESDDKQLQSIDFKISFIKI